MTTATPAAIKRLQSSAATRYEGDSGPRITVKHVHPITGAALSTTGRLIAETTHEIAVMVRSTPEVISCSAITYRSDIASMQSCGACGTAEGHGDNEVCDLDEEAIEVMDLLTKAADLDHLCDGMGKVDIARLSGVSESVLSHRLLGDSVRGVDGLLLRAGLVERVVSGAAVRYRRTCTATDATECALIAERAVAGTDKAPAPCAQHQPVVTVERESEHGTFWIVRVDGVPVGGFTRLSSRQWFATRTTDLVRRSQDGEWCKTRTAAVRYVIDAPAPAAVVPANEGPGSFTLHLPFLAQSPEEALRIAAELVEVLQGADDWEVSDSVDWAEIITR